MSQLQDLVALIRARRQHHAAGDPRGHAARLRKRGLLPDHFDVTTLATLADGFSGAEIEQAIVAALYAAHAARQPLDGALVAAELRNTRPLSVLMAEQVTALRDWARSRTVPAG